MGIERIALTDTSDFQKLALQLSRSLLSEENQDIAAEFPETVARYTGDTSEVAAALYATSEKCQLGVREQFITMVNGVFAGMGVVRLVDEPPEGIPSHSPNISGFMLKAYRNQGIATINVEHRLSVVHNNFGGLAHTVINDANLASRTVAARFGFHEFRQHGADHTLYVYP